MVLGHLADLHLLSWTQFATSRQMNNNKPTATYPHCPFVSRTVQIGGKTKTELLQQLTDNGVQINDAGKILFASDRFPTTDRPTQIETIELTVRHLGFTEGAKLPEIFATATQLDLRLCPIELGPHVRLQFLDQSEGCEGHAVTQHCAPPGSITIASEPVTSDHTFPKGFYLRRINGTLWLRGYRCDNEHVWDPSDRFLFAQPNE